MKRPLIVVMALSIALATVAFMPRFNVGASVVPILNQLVTNPNFANCADPTAPTPTEASVALTRSAHQ